MEVTQSAAEKISDELDIFEGAESVRDVAPTASVEGRLPEVLPDAESSSGDAPAPFTGKVVGSRGEPIEGAEVLISRNWHGMRFMANPSASEPLITDSAGVFLVRNLPRHELKIEVRASGYAFFREGLARQAAGISSSATEPGDLGSSLWSPERY